MREAGYYYSKQNPNYDVWQEDPVSRCIGYLLQSCLLTRIIVYVVA